MKRCKRTRTRWKQAATTRPNARLAAHQSQRLYRALEAVAASLVQPTGLIEYNAGNRLLVVGEGTVRKKTVREAGETLAHLRGGRHRCRGGAEVAHRRRHDLGM